MIDNSSGASMYITCCDIEVGGGGVFIIDTFKAHEGFEVIKP
jgi:hypothetical protein